MSVLYEYVSVCINLYACLSVCARIYLFVYKFEYMSISGCMVCLWSVFVNEGVSVCVYECVSVCVYKCVCLCVSMHACAYECVCVCGWMMRWDP